jgi:hypothetical protein
VNLVSDRRRGRRSRALLLAPTVAALVGLALAAPGFGTTGGTAPERLAAMLSFSRCMRAHGVPGYPDPKQVAGGGIQVSGARSGLNPLSPLYLSATRTCSSLLPGGRPSGTVEHQELARMLRTSQCMRAHGVSQFPDPTVSPPSNRAGFGSVTSNGFVWLAIPDSIDLRSPATVRAAAACKLSLG